jgi:hypothetical protein
LLDRRRTDVFSCFNVRKLGGFYAADPDIVRQLDQDFAGGCGYFKRLFFDRGGLSPDRNRFAFRRLRLGQLELKCGNKQD